MSGDGGGSGIGDGMDRRRRIGRQRRHAWLFMVMWTAALAWGAWQHDGFIVALATVGCLVWAEDLAENGRRRGLCEASEFLDAIRGAL